MTDRKRHSPKQAREAALEAAREILIADGPSAVTLQAVGKRMGRSHANLLHHFGSAAGLKAALADHLAARVCDEITLAVRDMRSHAAEIWTNEADARNAASEVVRLAFDTFSKHGGAALVIWMMLSGEQNALTPVAEHIDALIDQLYSEDIWGTPRQKMRENSLALMTMALGDALIGDEMRGRLGVSTDVPRRVGEEILVRSLREDRVDGDGIEHTQDADGASSERKLSPSFNGAES